jgi:hypothetical protein
MLSQNEEVSGHSEYDRQVRNASVERKHNHENRSNWW